MSELFKIVLTTLFTVSGGIIVGRIITSFFIQPVNEYRVVKGEIIDSLIYYKNIYLNPGEMKEEIWDETYSELRRRATQLMAKTYAIRWRRFWELVKLVDCCQNIKKAQANLIGLSNSLDRARYLEGNEKRLNEIIELLKIEGWV